APTPVLPDNGAAGGTDSGGYIHAPSLAQAATAAVLRAGHLTHAASDAGSSSLAIDLSSSRVRMALELLDGVRQGQSLGALLGYRAERSLHEAGAHTAVEVVRRLAPPPVVNAPGTAEGLPPRSVCDGLALSRMDRAAVIAACVAPLDGQPPSASVKAAIQAAVGAMLAALLDQVDAVADLLLAESVHQIVQGNPDRAAAALDTLNRGEGATADPAVVRTPRTGSTLSYKLMLAIGPDAPTAAGWASDGVRAQAAPQLSAWAGHLLGDPAAVRIGVTVNGSRSEMALVDLKLGALDLVHEQLGPRVLRHARLAGTAEGAVLDLHTPTAAPLMAVAAGLNALLTRAREGTGLDLMRPQDRGSVVDGAPPRNPDTAAARFTTSVPDVDRGERRKRLDAARLALGRAIAALPVLQPTDAAPAEAGVADALDLLAGFGIAPGGDPSRPPDTDALIAIRLAATRLLAASQALPDDAAALFGEGFAVPGLSAAPFPDTVAAALAHDPIAQAADASLAEVGGRTHALDSWIETQGRVRASVGRLADVLLTARLRSASPGAFALRALQLPVEPFAAEAGAARGQWIGLRFPAALGAEPVTGFVLHTLGTVDAAAGMHLVVIDEWSEVVPSADTTTGIAFGYDAPGARPPQSVLLAVPPVAGTPWTTDSLAGVVGETLDLAKMRMVDLSAVAWAGRFLPTVHLTDGDVASGFDTRMRELVALADKRYLEIAP
ncbi:MAG: hypothetical protein JWQ11_279, partial [Rhizobacter sp.]|nr:hypothetical protein [Rhizobacter sp.]